MNRKIEIHPHEPFVPAHATVLILGSFPPFQHSNPKEEKEEWFYQSKYNQFWKIMRLVYQKDLQTVKEKKDLFFDKGIAVADIFLQVERSGKGNSDQDLKVVEYNDKALNEILKDYPDITVLFTSQFVGKHFSKIFPAIVGEYLPSPSPRFARMSLPAKAEIYKEKLPD